MSSLLVGVTVVILARPKPTPLATAPTTAPRYATAAGLVKSVYDPVEKGGTPDTGFWVRIPFEEKLLPSENDPRIWHYYPTKLLAPSIRVEFENPPALPLPAPVCVVVGHVERFDRDGGRRLNGIPGLVVITSAHVATRFELPE